jgi:hypothetical protein
VARGSSSLKSRRRVALAGVVLEPLLQLLSPMVEPVGAVAPAGNTSCWGLTLQAVSPSRLELGLPEVPEALRREDQTPEQAERQGRLLVSETTSRSMAVGRVSVVRLSMRLPAVAVGEAERELGPLEQRLRLWVERRRGLALRFRA